MSPYTKSEIKLARTLWNAADKVGTIQAGAMLEIAPHDRPELHTTTSMDRAFEALTGKEWDADYFANRFN